MKKKGDALIYQFKTRCFFFEKKMEMRMREKDGDENERKR